MNSSVVSASRFLVSASTVLVALCGEARIVHTPAAAIAANYQSGTNPAVDANGGIWSFHQRFWWNDVNKGDLTTPYSETATSEENLVGYVGIYEGSDTTPYILVNPTDHDLLVPAMSCHKTDRPIHAGEIVMHPYHFSDKIPHRSVLRFTVPRTGYYSFSALVRSMNNAPWNTSHRTDISVLVDNTIFFSEELIRPGDNQTYVDLGPITFDRKLLPQGTTIDLVVGCGFQEGGNLGYQGDGVAIDLKITEEDETATDLVDKSWNLNSAFWAEYQQETPAIPFNDPVSGTWAFYRTINRPFFFEYQTAATLMNTWWTNADAEGPMVAAALNDEPHIHVFNPNSTDSADAGLYNGDWLGDQNVLDHIAPGELTMHTGNPDQNLMIRFTVPEDGRYLVSALLRDVSANPSAAFHNGVRFYVMAGSCFLSEDYISHDQGHPASEHVAFRQVKTPELKAGQVIDLMLYSNGRYDWDGTAGRYTIMKLKGGKDPNTFYPAESFRANLAGSRTNPYTDADGCTWTVGKCTTPGSDFTPFSATAQGNQLFGWNDQNATAYGTLPVLQFNPMDALIQGATGSDIQPNHCLFPNEFYLHPNQRMYGVLRFQAPRDGVYSVHATARDLHAGNLGGDPGVICTLAGPGFYLGSAPACCDNKQTFCWANLFADDVYLRAGETLDLAVGVNGARQTNCDATGVYEEIHVDEVETPAFVSVDLRNAVGTQATPYALRGRVGWGDLLWNPTTFDADAHALTAAEMQSTASHRTRTGFSLVRTPGEGVEPLDGTAQTLGLNALLNDGVVSTNTSDVFTFTFTNLPPNQAFTLYLYGTTVEGAGVPTFESNGRTATPSLLWSRPNGNEVAVLKSASDASGVLSGSFYNSTTNSGCSVVFCGVQLAGAELLDYIPRATIFIVR